MIEETFTFFPASMQENRTIFYPPGREKSSSIQDERCPKPMKDRGLLKKRDGLQALGVKSIQLMLA
jgi:hypothetical protein